MNQEKWLICPICGSKTRLKLRENTMLEKFPLYCPKCKQETLINVKYIQIGTPRQEIKKRVPVFLRPFLVFWKIASIMPCKGEQKEILSPVWQICKLSVESR
ncbi:MAG: cysteine-rich KTR domain-containing protein [Lachnospiraceae bacterium]|nr:cysteine-rich KTR domain-containing protein [Lachnospiraceae bacterium]